MVLEKIFVLDSIERPTAGDIAFLLQTLNISTSELSARDLMSDESHRSYIISDSSSSKSSFSWTPPVRAITDGDIKTIKRHPSKKGKKSTGDDIVLMIAARAGYADIVELLDPTDKNGVTVLMRAAERDDIEAARALIPLQKGRQTLRKININGVWIFRRGTALMRAASCGHAEVVRLLVEREGGMQDSWDWSALMYATYSNKLDCTKLLAEREKDMKTSRVWNGFPPGTTALDIAKRMGYKEIASILSE
ncbi:Ankyrin repeat protein [Giardia duodenalis]|uniref:Ankyrin repeat protein n=1 Tax=Giardia intestinalis TaxID=5741 RepID=V6TNA8_GIAIN|nr:Ankyrin repeat protein [Giardia intestinalis]